MNLSNLSCVFLWRIQALKVVDLCQAMSVAKRVSEEYGCRLGSELNRGTSQTSQTSQVRLWMQDIPRGWPWEMASIGFHKRHSGHRIASVTLMNCRLWRWIHAGRVWRATDCAQWPWAMYTGEKYCIQTDSSNFVTWGQEVGYAIRFEDRWTQSYFITQCYQASKIE